MTSIGNFDKTDSKILSQLNLPKDVALKSYTEILWFELSPIGIGYESLCLKDENTQTVFKLPLNNSAPILEIMNCVRQYSGAELSNCLQNITEIQNRIQQTNSCDGNISQFNIESLLKRPYNARDILSELSALRKANRLIPEICPVVQSVIVGPKFELIALEMEYIQGKPVNLSANSLKYASIIKTLSSNGILVDISPFGRNGIEQENGFTKLIDLKLKN